MLYYMHSNRISVLLYEVFSRYVTNFLLSIHFYVVFDFVLSLLFRQLGGTLFLGLFSLLFRPGTLYWGVIFFFHAKVRYHFYFDLVSTKTGLKFVRFSLISSE